MRQIELTATLIRERHEFINEETRTVIADAETGTDPRPGATVTLKGEADRGQLQPGMLYRFWGQWREHWRHGRQFCFTAFTAEEPPTEEAMIAYLKQCPGVGDTIAACLVEQFKLDAVRMLREEPEVACADVPRFSEKKAREAAAYLKEFKTVEKTKIDLLELLRGRGFPKKTIERAMAEWGSAAAWAVRRNPYLLMKFRGCGFLLTDKMFLDLGHNPARLKRQALCAWHCIARNSEGHTWYPEGIAMSAIRQSVAGAKADPERALWLAYRGQLLAHTVQQSQCFTAETRKASNEHRLSEYVRDALTEADELTGTEWPLSVSWPPSLSQHQFDQLHRSVRHSTVGILAGSPGTGKTFTTAALLKCTVDLFGSDCVAATAPTGKAAVRLTESLQANGVPLEATTIHRLLQVESTDSGDWRFKHGEQNPLPHRFVVVDETSMVDTDLMAHLFAARAMGTHILLVGDVNQLPPVGHGAPLRDLIAAGVPTGELREIQRNSGRIVQACAEIRDTHQLNAPRSTGDTWDSDQINDGHNLHLVERSDPEQVIEWIESATLRANMELGLDPTWDVQILVPVNKKSELSRKILNQKLQGLLNPTGEQVKGNPFKVGDKVINLKNGWLPSAKAADRKPDPEANADGKVFVANGEQAEVMAVEPARTIVRLWNPSRLVIIPHGQKQDDEGDSDDDRGSAGTWDLGYAISGHKSQGSEWPVVIVVLDSYPGAQRVMSRQWIYTAISRAKRLCVLVGSGQAAQSACRRDAIKSRRTFLAERIRGEFVYPLTPAEIDEMFGPAAECEAVEDSEAEELETVG